MTLQQVIVALKKHKWRGIETGVGEKGLQELDNGCLFQLNIGEVVLPSVLFDDGDGYFVLNALDAVTGDRNENRLLVTANNLGMGIGFYFDGMLRHLSVSLRIRPKDANNLYDDLASFSQRLAILRREASGAKKDNGRAGEAGSGVSASESRTGLGGLGREGDDG